MGVSADDSRPLHRFSVNTFGDTFGETEDKADRIRTVAPERETASRFIWKRMFRYGIITSTKDDVSGDSRRWISGTNTGYQAHLRMSFCFT